MIKMKFHFQVLLVIISLYLGVVLPMSGGGRHETRDFAFTVLVKNGSRTVCVGVIDSETTFITASRCLNRVDVSQTARNQFVASVFSTTRNVPIETVVGGKPGDTPDDGMSEFPDFATVLGRANPPGLKVLARDEAGRLTGHGPTYTPWPEEQEAFENLTAARVSGIVVGSGNMAAAMRMMTDAECDAKLTADVPERDRMDAYMSFWSQNLTARDYFCATRGDNGGRYPPGNPCTEDLGAPFIYNGSVWGTLIGAWCVSETNYTALFRTGVRSWDVRRFDGSLTDRPPTTLPSQPNTTRQNRDESTKPGDGGGGAAQNEVLGPIYSYFLTIIAIITVRKWFLETGGFFFE